MTRIILALAALSLLSACNVPITEKPLFTAADEAGAPALRPGVWVLVDEPGCNVDFATRIDTWPDCAGGGHVEEGKITGHDRKQPAGTWEVTPFIFAAGDPRIAQLQIKEDQSTGSGDSRSQLVYGYAAARPTKTDAEGRITAVTYWMVLCGPPPPKNKAGADTALGTLKPLPGMKMKPGDPVCAPRSKDAVRGAGKASEAWKDEPAEAHWLRDGDK